MDVPDGGLGAWGIYLLSTLAIPPSKFELPPKGFTGSCPWCRMQHGQQAEERGRRRLAKITVGLIFEGEWW